MGLVLKSADQRGIERLPFIRMNYLVAAALAFFGAVLYDQTHISRPTALLAMATGVLFVAGLVVWARAIRAAGLALSVVAMRTAIVVPVLASAVIWREQTTALELAGGGLAVLALGLVLSEVRGPLVAAGPGVGARFSSLGSSALMWLVLLFVADGLVMIPAQVFKQHMPQSESWPFQAVLFITAFLLTTVFYYASKPRVDRRSLGWGSLLGACNLGNYLFLVMALATLPGIVVFPVLAAGEVGLLAAAGALVWRERVGVRSWIGIWLAVVALVLIQVGRAN